MSNKTLTMLLNTRIGAGDGQLLSDKVGGVEVVKKLWKRAINNSVHEAYRINDLVDIDNAEKAAEAFSIWRGVRPETSDVVDRLQAEVEN